jgi:hypothetical protein
VKTSLTLALAVAAFAAVPATAVTYSAFASFNSTNGNGGFTYGYTDKTTLTAFDTTASGANCAITGATCLISAANGVLPLASVGGALATISVPTDAVLVHPGDSDLLSNYVSFTAPAAGTYNYSISVQMRGENSTTGIGYTPFSATWGVVSLGSRGVLTTSQFDFATLNGTILLGAGKEFGVIIDRNDSYIGDSTGINYSIITAVPEPAVWGMLLAGFAMVGGVTRRRKSAVAA